MSTERRIIQTRLGRLAQVGKLAGGIAGGALSEGVRQLTQGRRPSLGDLLITPGNAKRLADRLSEMRGAAMKVGQLLSMESGELIPPILSEVLSRLRESAHIMPLEDVAQVLSGAWGDNWKLHFKRFYFTPLSAASIGQVHDAELREGSRLAIKIQYPGIRRSIDSDVDNVGILLRLFSLVPEEVDFSPVLEEAKRQLHTEADYCQEADFIRRFTRHLGDDPRYELPEVVESLTTSEVLAMSFLEGEPIEALSDMEPNVRNSTAASLLELSLRELFEWGLVQTDPNFANFRYHRESRRIQLLDFGATREYSVDRRSALQALLQACISGDDTDVASRATNVGYLGEDDPQNYRSSVVALLRAATEPVRLTGSYDFGSSELARRMSDIALNLRVREGFGRLPPPDVLFLHRKLGGLYLLLSRLRAKIPARNLIQPLLRPVDGNNIRDGQFTA